MGQTAGHPGLHRFWYKEVQRQIVTTLQSESYVVSRGDVWIFEELKWHFSQRASDCLELLNPKDIWEAVQILIKAEGCGLQAEQGSPGNENQEGAPQDNWRNRKAVEPGDGQARNHRDRPDQEESRKLRNPQQNGYGD